MTEKGRVAWDGCDFCWRLAGLRGQEWVLQALCREADKDVKPGMNPRALMG